MKYSEKCNHGIIYKRYFNVKNQYKRNVERFGSKKTAIKVAKRRFCNPYVTHEW